jgi:hypothetical protein
MLFHAEVADVDTTTAAREPRSLRLAGSGARWAKAD